MQQRGCNGLSYTLNYAQTKGMFFYIMSMMTFSVNLISIFLDKLDEEVVQDGVRIIIDRKAQLSLLGTCIFLKNDLSVYRAIFFLSVTHIVTKIITDTTNGAIGYIFQTSRKFI